MRSVTNIVTHSSSLLQRRIVTRLLALDVARRCASSTATTAGKKGPSVFESITSPEMPDYQIEKAFDDPFMKLLFEGHDVDYKQSVREALLQVSPKRETNFTSRTGPETTLDAHLNIIRQLRAVSARGAVSFAEVRSTPRHFPSFYEVAATCDPALAISAADHFTFAGLVATHGRSEIQAQILDGVDQFRTIGTVAYRELAAGDEAPFNTEARWDTADECFYLRGAAKFAVVNAASAHWACVVATVTSGKNLHRGTHVFFVRLRSDDGQLLPGVKVRYFSHQKNHMLDACGAGVIHFDNLKLTAANLPKSLTISRLGEVTPASGFATDVPPLQVLQQRRRIATAGLYTGMLKVHQCMLNEFTISKRILGHTGKRNFPMYGVQHIQTPLVCSFTKALVHFMGWLTLVPAVTDPSKPMGPEDETKLAGIVHCLQESLQESNRFADLVLGLHSTLSSSTTTAATTMMALRAEGYDSSSLIREVAYRSVVFDQGTTHWGWKVSSIFSRRFPLIDRFIKNPMYTPRHSDLNRHLMFFAHKHHDTKRRLQKFRDIERRKGGPEHQWFDWNAFRHRQVKHCGDAFMEVFLLDATTKVLEKSYDPRGRKLIRDMGWIYAVCRLNDNLDFHLQERMLPLGKAQVTQAHLDNIVTVMAPQTMNLVTTFLIPECWRAPAGKEAYWTIPGTVTGVERSEAVTVAAEPSKENSDRKEDHQDLQESPQEFDLLHGMDKKK